jgi:hypothetical protein
MCKRYPLGHGRTAWVLAQRLAAMAQTAWLGIRGRTGLQAADGNDLVSGPDPQGEGAGAAADDGKGAIVQQLERQNSAAAADPDEAGGEELGR